VTITLSGIAGFILSIGMAVDTNVLVFERLKEELRSGKNLHSASEESFRRSWPSIRDGHIATLVSCVFLVWFGTGFVQGFAVTLAIGVLFSLFTAIVATRAVSRLIFKFFSEYGNWMFLGHVKPDSSSEIINK
jgi:preprotein translocase subunit SecD